ncbi:MAG: hypothetical protein IBX44_02445 [Sulfurospirillum sp.]|nr:hypothetical protein [Sulfurospirillum sp.]
MKRVILKNSELFASYMYGEQSWSIPSWLKENESFLEVLKDTIAANITQEAYETPESFEALFSYLGAKNYAVFEERFVVCLSQGRLVYLTCKGFSKVSATPDLFVLENWKIRL